MESLELFALEELTGTTAVSISINFILCAIMSFIVRGFYIKYSTSLTGKHHIGTVLPILSLIVFLIIIVVKSSLALSLGLVGALSIVRFRTPIKEPEELVYLFLSIAVGLGYAAGYAFLTTLVTLSILSIIFFFLSNNTIGKISEYNLILSWQKDELTYEKILNEVMKISDSLKLVRLNNGPLNKSAIFLITPNDQHGIDKIANEIKKLDNTIDISFYESKTNW
jgi:hypothetical protein